MDSSQRIESLPSDIAGKKERRPGEGEEGEEGKEKGQAWWKKMKVGKGRRGGKGREKEKEREMEIEEEEERAGVPEEMDIMNFLLRKSDVCYFSSYKCFLSIS